MKKKNPQYIHSYLLNIILLCDVACRQISDPVDGDYANVLNGPQEILNDNETPPCLLLPGLTLKEMRYLQTPDLSVDFISSSR